MSRTMLWATSILTGLAVVSTGAGLTDLIGDKWSQALVLLVAAAQAGVLAYQRGLYTPVPDDDDDDDGNADDWVGVRRAHDEI